MPPKQPSVLRVVPNPYCALDVDGEPCGVAYRASRHSEPIGAVLDMTRSRKGCDKYTFSPDVVSLPNVLEHRKLVSSGQLVAVDAETARLCGFSEFHLPGEELLAKQAQAAEQWRAQHGELPAFAIPAPAPAPPPKSKTSPPASAAAPKGDA